MRTHPSVPVASDWLEDLDNKLNEATVLLLDAAALLAPTDTQPWQINRQRAHLALSKVRAAHSLLIEAQKPF